MNESGQVEIPGSEIVGSIWQSKSSGFHVRVDSRKASTLSIIFVMRTDDGFEIEPGFDGPLPYTIDELLRSYNQVQTS